MKKISVFLLLVFLQGIVFQQNVWSKTVRIWLFGDSTVKDYFSETITDTSTPQDACSTGLKIAGWGEFLKYYLAKDSLSKVSNIIKADTVVIINKAIGGRTARAYINGKDSNDLKTAYAQMQAGDYLFVQFGHNDEADCVTYPDRCTPIADYKKYICMYIDSVKKHGGIPILVTPMVRRGWPFYNTHDNSDGSRTNQQIGNYSLAMQQVAKEKSVACIDLTQRSIDLFNSVGDTAAQYQYYRIFRPAAVIPTGCTKPSDGTHFQPKGGQELARQVFYGLQNLFEVKVTKTDTLRGYIIGTSNGVKDKANKNFLKLANNFNSGSGWYEKKYNPNIQIAAYANKGYKFESWSGDLSGNTNPIEIPINKNYNITANYSVVTNPQYTINTKIDGNGNISIIPLGTFYEEGTNIALKASVGFGNKFYAWIGDIRDTSSNTTIKIQKDLMVNAHFVESNASVIQAEQALTSVFKQDSTIKFFTGKSYIKATANTEDSIIWYINSIATGYYYIYFRYTNSSGQQIKPNIYINNTPGSVGPTFNSTANNETWTNTAGIVLNLNTGINKIKLVFKGTASDVCIDYIKIVGNTAFSIASDIQSDIENDLLQIVPNPSDKDVSIYFHLNKNLSSTLTITDLQGKILKKYSSKQFKLGENVITINKGELIKGVYHCILTTENKKTNKTLIIY